MKTLTWFVAGAITALVLIGAAGFLFVKTRTDGFSARSKPSGLEEAVATTARRLALPAGAKEKRNPVTNSSDVLQEARAHWADHCALCHANDGGGSEIGRQMYPPAPDMRKAATQDMTDGELFYTIENGIRLTGMPAWGTGKEKDTQDSWKLVHLIRHLPALSPAEIKEMEKMNPKSRGELEEELQEQEFLKGQAPAEAPKAHHHH